MSKLFIRKGLPLLCVLMLLSLCAVGAVFAQESHWADGPLQKWQAYGVLGGYEDGDLRPDNSLTRAEAAQIISSIISAQNYPAAKTFADVNPEDWYYASVHNVVAAGAMVGIDDSAFGANEPLTREQTATILYRLFQQVLNSTAKKTAFADFDRVSGWATEPLSVMAGNGYINGYEDGTVNPSREITRAEFISILDHVVPNVVFDQPQASYTGNVLVVGGNVDLSNSAISGNVLLAKAAVQNPPRFAAGFTGTPVRVGLPKTAVSAPQTQTQTPVSETAAPTPTAAAPSAGSGGGGGGGGGGSVTVAVTFDGQYQVMGVNYVLLSVTAGSDANCTFALDGETLTATRVNTSGSLVKVELPAGPTGGVFTAALRQNGRTLLSRELSFAPGAAAPKTLYGETSMTFSEFFHDITADIDAVLPAATTFAAGGTAAVPEKFITQGTRTGNNGTMTYADGDKLEKVDAVSSATYGDTVHFMPEGNLVLRTGPDGRMATHADNAIIGVKKVQVGVDFDLYVNAKLLEGSGRGTAQSANVAAKVEQAGFTVVRKAYASDPTVSAAGVTVAAAPEFYAVKYMLTDGNWGKRIVLNPSVAKALPGTALETEEPAYGGNWGDKVSGVTHGALQAEYAGANYWDNFAEYLYGGYIEDSSGHTEPLVFLQNLFSHRMHEDFDIAISPSRFARLGRLNASDTYKVTVFAYGFKDVETEISFTGFVNGASRIEGATAFAVAEGGAPISFNVLDMDNAGALNLSGAALFKGTAAVNPSDYQLTRDGQAVKVTLNTSLFTGSFQGSYTLRLVPNTDAVTSKDLTFSLTKLMPRPQLRVDEFAEGHDATEAAPLFAVKGSKLYFTHDDFAAGVITAGRSGYSTIKPASAEGAGTTVGDALARAGGPNGAGNPYYIDLGSSQFEEGNTYVLTIYSTGFEPQAYYIRVPEAVEALWLDQLSNPFLGQWQFTPPDFPDMTVKFNFKTDGFWDYEIVGMPADEGGVGTAGYIVFDNQMITYDESEGAVGYTFEVTDNNTISVTEFEPDENGTLVPGETAPFVRTAGSPVNREDKPFALNHPYLGTWRFDGVEEDEILGLCHFIMDYTINTDGTFVVDGTVETPTGDVMPMNVDGYYLIYGSALVMYMEGEGFETAAVTLIDSDTITVAEGDEPPVTMNRVKSL
ncbi:MAG: S-layer homology domain-containing protein [Peptococcaceae bacterium]|jgi:hypothetical protein|nr:S-layer homology domain-containing protein [Peptococcaceae bacterium]